MSKVGFIASVRSENIREINFIAGEIKKLGCEVNNIMEITGVITGTTDDDTTLEDLSHIRGIKYVEPDRDIRAL